MHSIGEADILIESTIAGRMRIKHLAALDALRPRIGLVVGVDLSPITRTLDSSMDRPEQYWLTDLRGDIRLSEKGPSIGIVHWTGMHREVRALPYPSESDLQLACDLDLYTLKRLEQQRNGKELTLWIELWPRLEYSGGYLSTSTRGFRIAVPRADWLRFLEDVGYGTYELLELSIPPGSAEFAHRAIDNIRDAQRQMWAGNPSGALTDCRKALEALYALAPKKDLETLLAQASDPRRGKFYSGISSRLKDIASIAVHDYGRDATFSRAEIAFVIRTTASLTGLVLNSVPSRAEP